MTEQSGNSSSPSGQVVLESPTSSGRAEGKGTNEELQATMIQVLKSMEKISLENKDLNKESTKKTISGVFYSKRCSRKWDEPGYHQK